MTEQEKQEIIQALKEELSKELLEKKSSLMGLRPNSVILVMNYWQMLVLKVKRLMI